MPAPGHSGPKSGKRRLKQNKKAKKKKKGKKDFTYGDKWKIKH